jgi:hypothetical protein
MRLYNSNDTLTVSEHPISSTNIIYNQWLNYFH